MLRTSLLSGLALIAATLTACVADSSGDAPPLGEFHYPIAAAISGDGNWLYVVNSDFNLEYNGGSVVAVDLAQVGADIANGHSSAPAADGQSYADERRYVNLSTASNALVQINPFATAAALSQDGSRLYVTVRGDGTLTWIDVTPNTGVLSCGRSADSALCSAQHRVGRDRANNRDGIILPSLPAAVSVVSGADGERYIAVAHQQATESQVSLFYDDGSDRGPTLRDWVAGLPGGVSSLYDLTPSGGSDSTATQPTPRWYALSRSLPVVGDVRVGNQAEDSFVAVNSPRTLTGVAGDVGLRSMVRDPCIRTRAYATSRPGPGDGTQTTRSGDQLLRFDLSDPANPVVDRAMAMPAGPSNLVAIAPRGTGRCADTHSLVYVVNYDARKLYVIDGDDWREVGQIRTQAGPHAIVADPQLTAARPAAAGAARARLYLVDFIAMCIEVIDADPDSMQFNRVIFTVGDIVPPKSNL